VPAEEVIATGRDAARLKELASDLGVTVRQADFADPATLAAAFKGVDKMLLVSTTTVGERFDNHRRAIDAARDSGVSLIVYTSTLNASGARMLLADEHRRTEEYLVASGVPCVILRNGWYLENYTDQLPVIVQHGAVLGSPGADALALQAERTMPLPPLPFWPGRVMRDRFTNSEARHSPWRSSPPQSATSCDAMSSIPTCPPTSMPRSWSARAFRTNWPPFLPMRTPAWLEASCTPIGVTWSASWVGRQPTAGWP